MGEVPAALVGYDEMWLRETVFVVRYVGRGPTVDVQSGLAEDYVIATVPTASLALS
ncbi:hypothetical protein [Cryptosporangium japonicum]|uniref:Uncharacterized protein n=1 Tax=Cryptosporangium japonicum TaxID=80872 RepID=A0ABN0THT3_9ACTN